MKLFFLRHGIAEDRRSGFPDEQRRLTAEGIDEMRDVGQGMKALGLQFEAILTSPLTRARETAELAARALGQEDRLHEEPRLASGATFSAFEAALQGRSPRDSVLLVGHEPDLS